MTHHDAYGYWSSLVALEDWQMSWEIYHALLDQGDALPQPWLTGYDHDADLL